MMNTAFLDLQDLNESAAVRARVQRECADIVRKHYPEVPKETT